MIITVFRLKETRILQQLIYYVVVKLLLLLSRNNLCNCSLFTCKKFDKNNFYIIKHNFLQKYDIQIDRKSFNYTNS